MIPSAGGSQSPSKHAPSGRQSIQLLQNCGSHFGGADDVASIFTCESIPPNVRDPNPGNVEQLAAGIPRQPRLLVTNASQLRRIAQVAIVQSMKKILGALS
jgi:hypothetical protein